jgi:hypothetical protein
MSIRFFIAWASTFVAWMAGSFVVHGVLLQEDYMKLQNLFRSPEEAKQYFAFMLAAHLILAGAFVWIYRQGAADKPFLGQGLRFGIAVACLTAIPFYMIYYVVQPMPGGVVLRQMIFDSLLIMALGVLVAWFHRLR